MYRLGFLDVSFLEFVEAGDFFGPDRHVSFVNSSQIRHELLIGIRHEFLEADFVSEIEVGE
jgi:hypothetical protein